VLLDELGRQGHQLDWSRARLDSLSIRASGASQRPDPDRLWAVGWL
jgi:hypothetical protein